MVYHDCNLCCMSLIRQNINRYVVYKVSCVKNVYIFVKLLMFNMVEEDSNKIVLLNKDSHMVTAYKFEQIRKRDHRCRFRHQKLYYFDRFVEIHDFPWYTYEFHKKMPTLLASFMISPWKPMVSGSLGERIHLQVI